MAGIWGLLLAVPLSVYIIHAVASIITLATGSAAPQCGAAYPQHAASRSPARLRRTGVRRSQRSTRLRACARRYRVAGMMTKAHAVVQGEAIPGVYAPPGATQDRN
ncbi:hypothetical protein THSYN_30955 (plasmid) [Candidatus Thiodictyon syntrophicum]|uniref:Uncharacterized protein n=1 Tax=Candidatus Thiodictyon syntrophicum TaxID=1166950 RepID=A0A2K8UIJ6_9GAMM|nr:hypothetical protein THSYN_30955 [Candidatus Thiodictyon syntrophicum]